MGVPIAVEGSWKSRKHRVGGASSATSDERLRLWLEHLPVLGWMRSADGCCLWFNRAWREFFGATGGKGSGDLRVECAHAEDRERCATAFSHAFEAQAPSEVVFRARRHDGSYCWLFDQGVPVHDESGVFVGYVGVSIDITAAKSAEDRDDGRGWMASTTDMTEQRRIENELRRERIFLRQVIDATPGMIFVKDREGRFLLGNEALARSCGTTVENLMGKSAADFQRTVAQVARFREADMKVMSECKALFIPEEEVTLSDGRTRFFSTGKMPLFNDDGTCDKILGVATDITERREARKTLEQAKAELERRVEERAAELTAANEKIVAQMQERLRLENALLDISEQEQRRLGQDLHDGLCQSLSGLALMGRSLTKTLEERGLHELAAQAQRLAGLIHESAEEARDAARGLHPVVMDSEGLVSALHELAARTHGQVRCRLRCERVVLIADNGAALHLYRIAQEAVVNALKHAGARCITLSLRMRERVLMLGVSDDGHGMPEVLLKNHGMGIRLMQYRADVIGADFSIRRRRNGGTRITCALRMPTVEDAGST